MKKIIQLLVILIISSSCNNTKIEQGFGVISKANYDSLYFPIQDSIYNIFAFGQVFKQADTAYFAAQFRNKNYKYENKITVYNINDTKTINEIYIEQQPINSSLRRFNFVTKDSIIIFNTTYEMLDSCLSLIDFTGNVKKIYSVNNPFLTTYKHNFSNDSTLVSIQLNSINFSNNKVFFTTTLFYSRAFGTNEFIKNKYPLVGYFDLEKDTVILNHNIWFPNLKEGGYLENFAKDVKLNISENGNPIISFSYTPDIIEWDINNNTTLTHSFTSQIVGEIPFLKESTNQYIIEHYFYGTVRYIDSLEIYVRDVFFPKKIYGKLHMLEVFANNKFEYIGEFSNSKYGNAINLKSNNGTAWETQYVGRHNWAYSEYIDSLKLVKANYVFGKVNTDSLKSFMFAEKDSIVKQKQQKFCSIMGNDYKFESYSNNLMINYTKKLFNIEDTNSFSLFVITDNGCHTCDDYILSFINMNNSVINATKACVLLAGSNTKYFNKLISENNLLSIDNLVIDTTGIYKDLHPFNVYNTRLVLVKDNKIVSDTIYMPNDLDKMVFNYINFYNFEME